MNSLDESSNSPSIESFVGSMEHDDVDTTTSEPDVPMVNAISNKATKNVIHLKILVITILIVSASTLAACAFAFIKRSETAQFESKFGYDAHKVFQSIGSSLDSG